MATHLAAVASVRADRSTAWEDAGRACDQVGTAPISREADILTPAQIRRPGLKENNLVPPVGLEPTLNRF
jgi:hypothetical protein